MCVESNNENIFVFSTSQEQKQARPLISQFVFTNIWRWANRRMKRTICTSPIILLLQGRGSISGWVFLYGTGGWEKGYASLPATGHISFPN